jgi:AbiV family abortive infection protein
MPIDRELVLEGILRYLEEAVCVLQDAHALYQERRFASTVLLATVALEHLGQSFRLIELCVDEKLATLTNNSLRKHLRNQDHVKKLAAGLVSFTTTQPNSIPRLSDIDRDSPNFDQTLETIRRESLKMHSEAPDKIHNLRTTSQYPQLTKTSTWKCSSEITGDDAHHVLVQVGNNLKLSQYFYLKRISGLEVLARKLDVAFIFDDSLEWCDPHPPN